MQLQWLLLLWLEAVHLADGIDAVSAKKAKTPPMPVSEDKSSPSSLPVSEGDLEEEPMPLPPRRRQDLHSFLLYPEDFETDPDVDYLASKLHEPAAVANFYASAAAIYTDLEVWWRELSEDRSKAEKFLQYVRALALAGAEEPLTVTNLVYAIGKHFVPLFKHRSKTLDSIAAMLTEIEQDIPKGATDPSAPSVEASKSRLGVMTYFFHSFTLREAPQFEQFVWLMSRADLLPVSAAASASATECFDMSRTALSPHHNRVRTILANGIAKIGLLLKLFLDEQVDGVMDRSRRLVRRLWDLHLRRLLSQEKTLSSGDENAVRYWTDPRHYRKTPINFTFADWDPAVAALKAQKSQKPGSATHASASSAGKPSRLGYNYWTSLILIIALLGLFSGAVCLAISWYRQRRAHRFNHSARQTDREEVYQL